MTVISQPSPFRFLYAPRFGRSVRRKLLLACGIAFPLLWVGMDVVASLLYDGYSYIDQTISELSAYDTPTRTFWLIGGVAYAILEIAFAAGVWLAAGRGRALRIVAGLLVFHAVINLTLGPFSSMHQREVLAADGATFSDTLHLVLVAVGAVIFFSEIGLAAAALGRWFRFYSLATALAMLVFGIITSFYAPQVQDNEATPWVGVYERVNAYAYMLWVAVLAIALARGSSKTGSEGQE